MWDTVFKKATAHLLLPMLWSVFWLPITSAAQQPEWISNFLQRWNVEQQHHIWLLPPLKAQVAQILGHPYPKVRLTYWSTQNRTIWVLEEIGKDRPITTGIVIENGKIKAVEILKFREPRGGEVQLPGFRTQYKGAVLSNNLQLDRVIDGISGATLSVRAVTKLARMALFLDQHIRKKP